MKKVFTLVCTMFLGAALSFAQAGGRSPGTVVRLYARGWQARRPSSRIRSATRPTLHGCPSRLSWAATRRHQEGANEAQSARAPAS